MGTPSRSGDCGRQVTLVRLEYWNAKRGDWTHGHAGVDIKDPATYVQRLKTNRGILARATDLSTGEEMFSPGGELL